MARRVWALADEELVETMSEIKEPNARQWIFKVQEVVSSDCFVEVAVTLWTIWTAWRKLIHESVNQSPHATHGFIR